GRAGRRRPAPARACGARHVPTARGARGRGAGRRAAARRAPGRRRPRDRLRVRALRLPAAGDRARGARTPAPLGGLRQAQRLRRAILTVVLAVFAPARRATALRFPGFGIVSTSDARPRSSAVAVRPAKEIVAPAAET